MKIGELSKRTDCSIQTIRYYEKEKLLQSIQRSEGNYRLYDEAAVEQLGFIKLCRSLDLSLSEIRQLIAPKRSPNAQPLGYFNYNEEKAGFSKCRFFLRFVQLI